MDRTPEGINLGKGASLLWSTVKGFCGQPQTSDIFNNEPVWDAQQCAKLFNRQFTPHPPTTSKAGRRTIWHLHRLQHERVEFTPGEVAASIKATKPYMALGPDDIIPIHLKYHGTAGIHFLMAVINLSLNTIIIISAKWSRIIPLLKCGKSFRPIVLLSPLTKFLKRLLPQL